MPRAHAQAARSEAAPAPAPPDCNLGFQELTKLSPRVLKALAARQGIPTAGLAEKADWARAVLRGQPCIPAHLVRTAQQAAEAPPAAAQPAASPTAAQQQDDATAGTVRVMPAPGGFARHEHAVQRQPHVRFAEHASEHGMERGSHMPSMHGSLPTVVLHVKQSSLPWLMLLLRTAFCVRPCHSICLLILCFYAEACSEAALVCVLPQEVTQELRLLLLRGQHLKMDLSDANFKWTKYQSKYGEDFADELRVRATPPHATDYATLLLLPAFRAYSLEPN